MSVIISLEDEGVDNPIRDYLIELLWLEIKDWMQVNNIPFEEVGIVWPDYATTGIIRPHPAKLRLSDEDAVLLKLKFGL